MAGEQQTTVTETGTQQTATAPAGAKNTENQAAEHMIPISRFNEVNDELKALKAKNAAQEAAEAQAAEQRLKEQQRWQELAEQRAAEIEALKPQAQMANDLSAKLRAQIETEIAKWPEQVKAMAPAKDAPITAWLDWVDKARTLVKELESAKTPTHGNARGPKAAGSAGQNPPKPPLSPGMRL